MKASIPKLQRPWKFPPIILWMILATSTAHAASGASESASSSREGGVPTCYYPDGTISENDYACNLSSKYSACCAIDSRM